MRKLIIAVLTILFICLGCLTSYRVFYGQTQIVEFQFPLHRKWVFEADGQIRSTPVIYNQRVIVRTFDTLYVVDSLTGNLIWSYTLPKDLAPAPPIIQDDIVVVTHDSGITALSLTTGKLLWEFLDRNTRSTAFAAISNQDVVVVVDSFVLIRDIRTGELLWEIKNPYSRAGAIVALDEASNLIVVFGDQIREYDIITGKLLRNNLTERWSLLSGLYEENILYLERLEGGLVAYDLDKQEILWRREDLSLASYPPTKHQDVLFVGTGSSPPVAINALTGETLWETKELWRHDDYQTPLIIDKTEYIRSLFGSKIYALDVDDGSLIGSIKLGIPGLDFANVDYSLGPVQAGELIVFPTGDQLLAYGR